MLAELLLIQNSSHVGMCPWFIILELSNRVNWRLSERAAGDFERTGKVETVGNKQLLAIFCLTCVPGELADFFKL